MRPPIHDRILVIDKVLPSKECRAVALHRDSYAWTPARVADGDPAARTPRIASAARLHDDHPLRQTLTRSATRYAMPWTQALARHTELCVTDPYLIHYAPGGRYPAHRDDLPNRRERLVTIVWYLNDDFEGGETVFPLIGCAVTPRAGSMLLFPSSFLHAGSPVRRGNKLIATATIDHANPVPAWL